MENYILFYTNKALMTKLELYSKEDLWRNYLRPAIEKDLIHMTISDKPNSRNQRYIKNWLNYFTLEIYISLLVNSDKSTFSETFPSFIFCIGLSIIDKELVEILKGVVNSFDSITISSSLYSLIIFVFIVIYKIVEKVETKMPNLWKQYNWKVYDTIKLLKQLECVKGLKYMAK